MVEITNFTTVSSTEIFLQWMVTDPSTLIGDITSYEIVYNYTDQDEVVRSNITSVTDMMVSITVCVCACACACVCVILSLVLCRCSSCVT